MRHETSRVLLMMAQCKRVSRVKDLTRIKINGFFSIREIDLEFRRLNVLVGANGAGKCKYVSEKESRELSK